MNGGFDDGGGLINRVSRDAFVHALTQKAAQLGNELETERQRRIRESNANNDVIMKLEQQTLDMESWIVAEVGKLEQQIAHERLSGEEITQQLHHARAEVLYIHNGGLIIHVFKLHINIQWVLLIIYNLLYYNSKGVMVDGEGHKLQHICIRHETWDISETIYAHKPQSAMCNVQCADLK